VQNEGSENNKHDSLIPDYNLEKVNIINAIKDEISQEESNLNKLIECQLRLKKLKSQEIQFSGPILKQNGNPVFYPRTINAIQGQAGVHKSRFAETICSAFLKTETSTADLLGFEKALDEEYAIVYIDTERNITEQLPYALQSIQKRAGFNIKDHPKNFSYTSLLMIERKNRFSALNEYIKHIRNTAKEHLIIILDVSTDCIEDFNKTDKSMELIDLMNVTINESNVSFICLIHENPNSIKARGHFGTELMNKSSTLIQIGFEKDSQQRELPIIKIKYLKCRSTVKHEPIYIKYCDESKGLVLANPDEIAEASTARKRIAGVGDILQQFELYFKGVNDISKSDLIKRLKNEFGASQSTIETRIEEILDSAIPIKMVEGKKLMLIKFRKGKDVYFKSEIWEEVTEANKNHEDLFHTISSS